MAELMAGGAHLEHVGIVELLRLRRNMNDGGKRKYTEEQILGTFQTVESSETTRRTSTEPDQVGSDEDDIVRSAGRSAEPSRNDSAHPQG